MSAAAWSRSLWPNPSYSSPPALFLLFLGVVHHKACIRGLWWSWPRLRRLHDLTPGVSEGKQQGSFSTFAVFQNLLLPPRSEPMRHQNVRITIYSVQPIFLLQSFSNRESSKTSQLKIKLETALKNLLQRWQDCRREDIRRYVRAEKEEDFIKMNVCMDGHFP